MRYNACVMYNVVYSQCVRGVYVCVEVCVYVVSMCSL